MPSTRRSVAARPGVAEQPAKRPKKNPPARRTRTPQRPHIQDADGQEEDEGEDTGEDDHCEDGQREQEAIVFQQGIFQCPFSVPREGIIYLCEEFGETGRKTKGAVGLFVFSWD